MRTRRPGGPTTPPIRATRRPPKRSTTKRSTRSRSRRCAGRAFGASSIHAAISPLTSASLTPPPAASQGKTMPEKSDFYPADNPAPTVHINLLQGIINRLANNSSSCKTWCLTLTGALLSLAGATKVPALVVFVILPILILRYLDSRYLAQERAYRRH